MIDSNILKTNKILSSNVSHETLQELEIFTNSVIEKNRSINLIGRSTENTIKQRHIEDCAQSIEFIDKNDIKI